MDLLKSIGLDIDDGRGQTYDNTSILSGQYNGPCAARNLVGQAAVGSCRHAVDFFDSVQQL